MRFPAIFLCLVMTAAAGTVHAGTPSGWTCNGDGGTMAHVDRDPTTGKLSMTLSSTGRDPSTYEVKDIIYADDGTAYVNGDAKLLIGYVMTDSYMVQNGQTWSLDLGCKLAPAPAN